MRLDDTPLGAGRGPRFREMQFTSDGLVLGEGTVLAKMNDEGLRVDEDRVLTCLAVAFGRDVPPTAIGALRRVVKCWRDGDKALAAIHLAQIGLRKIDGEDADRLRLAARLIDGGMRPRDLARELGLVQPHVSKYSDSQPRVPAGNGRASGQWAGGQGAAAGGDTGGGAPLVEGRSASVAVDRRRETGRTPEDIHHVHEIPKDAVAVMRPDGTTVDDPKSPTGKLMAPPSANFQEVYNAGARTWNPIEIDAAVGHYGRFDFQRDAKNNTFYHPYRNASNYAVGVFMAGAGYPRGTTGFISESFASRFSSNYLKDMAERKEWTNRGWDDGHAGVWKQR